MYPEKIIALMALKTAVDADPRGKNIWADLHSQDENDKAGEQDWSQKVEVFTLLSSPESRVLTEEGEENKEEENARTSLESLIEGSIENSDTGDESGEEDLSGDNSVDFADEAPAQLVLAETNSRVQSPLLDIAFHSAIVAAAHTLEAPEILISLKLQKNSAAYPNQSHIRSLPSLHHRWPPTTTLHLMLQSESVVVHSCQAHPDLLQMVCKELCTSFLKDAAYGVVSDDIILIPASKDEVNILRCARKERENSKPSL
nr:unknown [Ipomoea trifida]